MAHLTGDRKTETPSDRGVALVLVVAVAGALMVLGALAPPAAAQTDPDPTADGVPEQPGAPSVTVLSATSVRIEWEAPGDGGSPITRYRFVVVGPRGWLLAGGAEASHSSKQVTGLVPGTEYGVSIRATNVNGDSKFSYTTSFLMPVSDPPDELAVRVTPTATTVSGGEGLDLSSSVTGSDGASETFRWSSRSGLGTFSDEEAPDPIWTAPAATSEIQYVTLTLSVSDDSGGSDSATAVVTVLAASGSLVPPLSEPVARLKYAVEQLLARPSAQDPARRVEQVHPWLRQAWDYANHTGAYADLGHEFGIETVSARGAATPLKCYAHTEGEVLTRCEPSRLIVGEDFLVDSHLTGPYRALLDHILAHELGHVFTLAPRIAVDGTSRPRPDLKAIAMVYFFVEHRCDSGPFFELIADVLGVSVLPTSVAGYWTPCGFGDEISKEAFDVVESMLAGEYPQWFIDRYGLEDGGFALNEFWAHVLETNDVSPFQRQALVWQLRGAFGPGYCSWLLTAEASKKRIVLFNPWSSEDDNETNCFEAEGWWSTLTPGQRVAALFGTTATVDEDAAARDEYGTMDLDLKRFVNEAAGDIYGDGEFYTIGAWWNSLDCRQRRIAVGDGNIDDDSSPYCAGYPGTGQPNDLSAPAKRHVDAVGFFLAGLPEVDEAPVVSGLTSVTYWDGGTGPASEYTAVDPEGRPIQWRLSGQDHTAFSITGGTLSFASSPDFENPDDADQNNVYEVTVEARDDGLNAGTLEVTVTVEDIDEAPVITTTSRTEFVYRENGTAAIFTFRAADPENAEISWDLSGEDDDYFEISSSGVLTFANQPDYETRLDSDNDNNYEVTVEATDETNNTGEFTLTVVVTNFDEPPELSPEDGHIEYDEDRTDSVESFRATDPEGESITWDLSGFDPLDFAITDGELTFGEQPDYENPADSDRNNVYQVIVVASDGTKTSRSSYTITVDNVDENGSVDLSSVQPQVDTQLQASASDPDNIITSTITWTWHRRNGTSNCVNGEAGWSLIDGATTSTYTPVAGDVNCDLRATASYTDGEGSSKTAQAVSDNPVQAAPVISEPPVFPSGGDYTRTVPENTPAGRDIGNPVTATDGNPGDTLTYTLRASDTQYFDIVESTGQIRTKAELNHESRSRYTVVVTATDPFSLSATHQVIINVGNVDEDPVVTTTGDITVRFDENSTRRVATYRATDPEGEAVTWSLSGADGTDFNISTSGVLSFNDPPDYEQPSAALGNEYLVTIVATESDTTTPITMPINTGRLDVTVIVDDIDEPPVIDGLDNVFYREDRTDLSVGLYRGTDPEGAYVADWRLTGPHSSHFEITGGELTFEEQPNYETRTTYRVTVHATDRTNHTGSLAVAINVNDVDEPPVITGPDEVTYGQNRTDTVARYQAVDPERAVITWDLVGAHSSEFDFVNGVLTFTDQPAYDANGNNEYFVTVRATDQTGNTGELQVVVTVTESAPPPPPPPPEETEPEDTEPEDTEPEDTEPEDTEPEDTEPEDTEPEDTEPEETEPEETEPEETEPEETEPETPDRPVRVAACELDLSSSTQPFSDLSDSSFAFNDVGCLVALEVTGGTSSTTYSPGQAVTREQMAAFIARLYKAITKESAPLSDTPFTDVPLTSFAYDDISRIYQLGITKGTSPTTYSPQQTVSREQMAAFIARLYKAITKEPAPLSDTPFTDVAPTSFAYDDIGRIFGLGITKGTNPTTYSPQQTVTREQMAAFIARLYRALTSPST